MKTWKLVSGIISDCLALFVIFQSMAAGLSNALSENGESSGTGGFLLAILLIAGGIVSIVTRKSEDKGGNIALIVVFLLAAMIGFTSAGSYQDLYIWASWCLICAIFAIISLIKNSKAKKNRTSNQ